MSRKKGIFTFFQIEDVFYLLPSRRQPLLLPQLLIQLQLLLLLLPCLVMVYWSELVFLSVLLWLRLELWHCLILVSDVSRKKIKMNVIIMIKPIKRNKAYGLLSASWIRHVSRKKIYTYFTSNQPTKQNKTYASISASEHGHIYKTTHTVR